MTLSPSKLSRRTQSRLLHLLPSLQASTDTALPRLMTMHWHTCSWMRCQPLVWPMPPPKNPSDRMLPTLPRSNDSFKCSARQSTLASPPSNSHDTPGTDAATASNAVATSVAATVAAMVAATAAVAAITTAAAVAATARAVAAIAAVAASGMCTSVAVAMAATMVAVMAVAMEEVRPQVAYSPHKLSGTRIGTTASPMAATSTTTTPARHVLAQVRATNLWRYAPTQWVATCAT
jgi:hypothetical protein